MVAIDAVMVDLPKDDSAWLHHLAVKVSDQSTAIQSLQSDIHRLVKLAEKQDGYNERQIMLAEKTIEHGRTFDRVFRDMEKYQGSLGGSIDKLAESLSAVSKIVTSHQTGIRVSWALFVIIAGLLTAYTNLRFQRVDEWQAAHVQSGVDTFADIQRALDRAEEERKELRKIRGAR